jgi:hypothetical protein
MIARLLWPSGNVMRIQGSEWMDAETFRAAVEELVAEAVAKYPDDGPPPLVEWEP